MFDQYTSIVVSLIKKSHTMGKDREGQNYIEMNFPIRLDIALSHIKYILLTKRLEV